MILNEGAETLVLERLPKLIDGDQDPLTVQQRLDPMKQVIHQRTADFRDIQNLSHIESKNLSV